jgi:hypothetical protein
MGTTDEENAYKQDMDRQTTENMIRWEQMQKESAERAAAEEAARKAAEGNQMVADGPAAGGWPDNEVQQAPQSGLDKVAGALRVGEAGDVAFARDLLNSGQAPLSSASAPAQGADGVKEQAGGVAGGRAAKPGLGLA